MNRRKLSYTVSLAADATLAATPDAILQHGGHLGIHVTIDNGAGGTPTDSPVGVWELYTAPDGVNFKRLTSAAIVTALAAIAATGNVAVSEWVVFDNVPGTTAKLLYNQTSGGLTSATATVRITT